MNRHLRWLSYCALGLLWMGIPWTVSAQNRSGSTTQSIADQQNEIRILREWTDEVKLDGGRATYFYQITYNYTTAETIRTIKDAKGNVIEQRPIRQIRPTPEEIEEAFNIITADTELEQLLRSNNAVLDGGFILYGDAGTPCDGQASRCLQIDMLANSRLQRVRYVVVDLVRKQIVSKDFNPSRDGNRN